jgi:ectoine hydroxylase-related dioxygenase (phytanoyl-CoA dioxygenase family)
VPWHQDYSYWTRTAPAGHVTCFVCLDDATPANGCLHVVPGSHRWSLLPKVPLVGAEAETMDSIKSVLTPPQLEQFHPTPILLRAGECSLHYCLTLHGSYANASDRPRRTVVLNYMRPDTRSASMQPIMPGAPAIPPGEVVEGELFPIAGSRHAR